MNLPQYLAYQETPTRVGIYRHIVNITYLPDEEDEATSKIFCGVHGEPLNGMVVAHDTLIVIMTTEAELADWASRDDDEYLTGDRITMHFSEVPEGVGALWHLEPRGTYKGKIFATAYRRVGEAPLLDLVATDMSGILAALQPDLSATPGD